ncbi:hypothetical protein GQ53DRAFT_762675 [Thozetella sp. PMI_491]|nr:hypothetical protein GQ53DRAFT_762675 [Thozetella sp. PMI_491]
MKFSHLLAMATTAMAASKGILSREVFPSLALSRRDAVSDVNDMVRTLNTTLQAQIYLIHARIIDIQMADTAQTIATFQGKINRNLDEISQAVITAYMRFYLGKDGSIDVGAELAEITTLSQSQADDMIKCIADIANIMRDISDLQCHSRIS